MKSNIFVPKRINVGFQERSSTYTGKLAYVIYYDEKGTLRKENPGMAGVIRKFPMKNLIMCRPRVLC